MSYQASDENWRFERLFIVQVYYVYTIRDELLGSFLEKTGIRYVEQKYLVVCISIL